jgi:hypothetical protein
LLLAQFLSVDFVISATFANRFFFLVASGEVVTLSTRISAANKECVFKFSQKVVED